MTERERVVREAIRDLAKVGLKIDSLSTHPETFCEILSEGLSITATVSGVAFPDEFTEKHFAHTFCGIPIKQVV